MEKYKEGDCTICRQYFTLLHWHHTVPQALGGKDSLQIPLCAQCHNQLHAHSEAIVARMRTGKAITRTYWRTPDEIENAQPYLEILVTAISSVPVEGAHKMWMISSRIPDSLHKALHLYKVDSGLRNLDQALLLCLTETLANKGYIENGNDNSQPNSNKSSTKNTKASLW